MKQKYRRDQTVDGVHRKASWATHRFPHSIRYQFGLYPWSFPLAFTLSARDLVGVFCRDAVRHEQSVRWGLLALGLELIGLFL